MVNYRQMSYFFRLMLGLAVSFFFIATPMSLAETVGNSGTINIPYGPGIMGFETTKYGSIKVGAESVIILEKKLTETTAVNSPELEGQIYLIKLAYRWRDRVEPFIKLGLGELIATWSESGAEVKAEGRRQIAWEFGGKVLLFESVKHGLRMNLFGSFLKSSPGVEMLKIDDVEYEALSQKEFTFSEWQAGFIVSYEVINKNTPYVAIVPYVGVRYSDSELALRVQREAGAIYTPGAPDSEKTIGLITGFDMAVEDSVTLGIEGRFLDENALTVGFTVLF